MRCGGGYFPASKGCSQKISKTFGPDAKDSDAGCVATCTEVGPVGSGQALLEDPLIRRVSFYG